MVPVYDCLSAGAGPERERQYTSVNVTLEGNMAITWV